MEIVGILLVAICTSSNPCYFDDNYITLVNSTAKQAVSPSQAPLYLPVLYSEQFNAIFRPFGYFKNVSNSATGACYCSADFTQFIDCSSEVRSVVYLNSYPNTCSVAGIVFGNFGFPSVRRYYHETTQREILYLNREDEFVITFRISSLSAYRPIIVN